MDKSWLLESRSSYRYKYGLQRFLDFAFHNVAQGDEILCPCKNCNNCSWGNREEVYEHLICDGFDTSYKKWIYHGEGGSSKKPYNKEYEKLNVHDNLDGLLEDTLMPAQFRGNDFEFDDIIDDDSEEFDEETARFYKLVHDARQEVYPGCKNFTKLSIIVRLLHIKNLHGWSNVSFNMLLQLLKELLPENSCLPSTFQECKFIIKDLGCSYEKIHACPNDCILYRKEYENEDACPKCGVSRYKKPEVQKSRRKASCKVASPPIPAKVLRYFPLKARIKKLFMSSKTANLMKWHQEGRTKDGKLRHPADSLAWKTFDSLHPNFASDPRNVRLGLASDGFNPYKTMSSRYSIWPVVLMTYNLAPWDCMKQPYLMLSLLIPGPSSPKRNIDVYLEPLIDELKELWEKGFDTYDASSKQLFKARVALLWTISDLPAYAMLSGWRTSGKLACPVCSYDTCSRYLKHSRKMCYMSHRRFLDPNHRWRKDRKCFDGTKELRVAPMPLTWSNILEILGDRKNSFGKVQKRKRNDDDPWTKKSIFFELPYWETNVQRHNLDVMHIEKNICENVVATLLNLEKSKDNLKARLDLVEMGIRKDIHPVHLGPNKIFLPPTRFTISSKEKDIFCGVLKGVKVPENYGSNISRCIQLEQHKILGLKSHDFHILMQDLLKVAVQRALPKEVARVIIKLSSFFKILCSKVIKVEEFECLDAEIALILCELEKIFPSSFFVLMVHLSIHLAYEARIAGPVHYRWMYPIERFLLRLKNYVRNRSHPEGSIVEGYIADECLTFCSRYLSDGVQTKFNKPPRNLDGPIGHGVMTSLEPLTWEQAHRYVLFNCDITESYVKEHEEFLSSHVYHGSTRKWNQAKDQHLTFHEWFEDRVKNSVSCEEVKWLSRGPNIVARRFSAYVVNGYKFVIESCERKTQNYGVMVTSTTIRFRSEKDESPEVENVTYYGVLKDILELDYHGHSKFVLFKCDWFPSKQDNFGLILVNFGKQIFENDPFVFATQVKQVYYIKDPSDSWHVVTSTTPRDLFDIYGDLKNDDMEKHLEGQLRSPMFDQSMVNEDENVNWFRDDVPGTTIDTHIVDHQVMREESQDDFS